MVQEKDSQVSLNILATLKDKQNGNGLSLGNYTRYHKYCTKKLRKARGKVGITQTPNKDTVTTARIIKIEKNTNNDENATISIQKNDQSTTEQKVPLSKDKPFILTVLLKKKHMKQSAKPNIETLRKENNIKHDIEIKRQPDLTKKGKKEFSQESEEIKVFIDQQRLIQALLIPLFEAENAWSFAIKLKQENEVENNKKQKLRYLKKLKRATEYADQIHNLITQCADERTQLESESYSAWMNGTFLLEQEKWVEARDRLIRARTIYDNLSKVGTISSKEMYKSKVNEIDTSIRFCLYNIQSGTDSQATTDDILALIDSSDDPALDLLKSKLSDVLEDTKKKQAQGMAEIKWNNRKVQIENEKVRLGLVSLENLEKEVLQCKSQESKLRLYDRIFILLGDTQKIIRDIIKGNANQSSDESNLNLRLLYSYISYLHLTKTIERNLIMVESYVEKLASSSKVKGVAALKQKHLKKNISAIDVVRLYEIVLQNVRDLQQVEGVTDEEAETLSVKEECYKSYRCFYLANGYANNQQWRESYALYLRTIELCNNALESIKSNKQVEKEEKERLESILNNANEGKLSSSARYILKKRTVEEDDSFATTTNTEKKKGKTSQPKVDILQRLEKYDMDAEGRIHLTSFPPSFECVPSKPVYFDIAGNGVDFPDFKDKAEKKKGWFSGFW